MIPAVASVLMMITNVMRILTAGPVGLLTDKWHPKRILPLWPLAMFVALMPLVILRNALGVYLSTAISAVFMLGQGAAFLALIYGLPKPENRSGHYTLQMLQGYVSGSVGPLVVGSLCDALGFMGTFVLIAILALVLSQVTRWLLSDISSDPNKYF